MLISSKGCVKQIEGPEPPTQRECARTAQLGLVSAEDERILSCGMREYPEPRPRDDKDAAQDLARDLADIAGQLASLKGEAHAWLRDPNYDTLKHRLERGRTLCPRGCCC